MSIGDELDAIADYYENEKGWHGLSCACGGGYKVGHRAGCPDDDATQDLAALRRDLIRARRHGDRSEVAILTSINARLEHRADDGSSA